MATLSQTARLAALFAALADPTRLRLLNLMQGREVCVCYFVEILGQSQPKISRHLAYLRRAGVVSARREGKWMHYRITSPAPAAAKRVLDAALHWLGEDAQMQGERKRLDQACCTPKTLLQVRNAPRPTQLKSKKASA